MMGKLENCLLIGNGLNRCLKRDSWDDLLKTMAEKYGVIHYQDSSSFPLEFESLVNQYQMKRGKEATDKIYLEMKQEIAEDLKKTGLPENAIHKELKRLPLDLLMTTNYDCLLERTFDRDYQFQKKENSSIKYLFSPTAQINGIKFYHPHGIAELPNTLCLGYEHYMGIVMNLREKINAKKNNKPENMKIKQVLFEESDPSDEWEEKFYTANIGIMGLGLTECEADLWWLITHRAFLYYSNYEGMRERIVNKIVYFDVINEGANGDSADKKQQKEERYHFLENEHVVVRTYVVGDNGFADYSEAYRAMIDHIEKEGWENLGELKECRG